MKNISIIIPIFNEEKYIEECIESILKQDYPSFFTEILIVDGRSTDKTRDIIKSYCEKYPYIKCLDNPHRTVPYAMNIGIKKSSGEYIIRLDAHASYPSNYFSDLINYSLKYNTDNIGGICITDVKNKSIKTWAIKTVLSHKFGVGNSIFRLGTTKPQIVDTVPFGCFKRDVFKRFGMYDERLVRNQDIELNKRITKGGGKILLIPEIICTYYTRETFLDLSKNNFKNGLWNIITIYYTNNIKSLSLRHFIPLFFVLSLIFPVLLSIIYFDLILLAMASFIIYSFVLLYICISITGLNLRKLLYLFIAFTVLHISYGLGSIVGIFKINKFVFKSLRHLFNKLQLLIIIMI